MKIEIHNSYHYGAWELSFKKVFDLPFIPQLGMTIIDEVKGDDFNLELKETQYTYVRIYWWVQRSMFEIDIRNRWPLPVRDDVIDEAIERHSQFGWERIDRTDVVQLKDLMQRDFERTQK